MTGNTDGDAFGETDLGWAKWHRCPLELIYNACVITKVICRSFNGGLSVIERFAGIQGFHQS